MTVPHALQEEPIRNFSAEENATWCTLYDALDENRKTVAHPMFVRGLESLSIFRDHIPTLDSVNQLLHRLTGWSSVAVKGLEAGHSFYPALAKRKFPVGNFIRSVSSAGFTPAPDIFHDLYGHIPFLVDNEYADFCEQFGQLTQRFLANAKILHRLERFFWFTVEFGLCETANGRRIVGAGILSSREESIHALSSSPVVRPFDVAAICAQDYQRDEIQNTLFVLKSMQQLYSSLREVERVCTF